MRHRVTALAPLLALIWLCAAGAAPPRIAPGALVDYSANAGAQIANPDADGVGLMDYGGALGRQYNPVYIANVAQALYYLHMRRSDEESRRRFLVQIDWLRKNAETVGPDMAAYTFRFQWNELKPGWRSGLAQAQAIGALIRAYYLTGDTSLLPLIKRLKNFMFLPVEQGGVAGRTPEGRIWIEEFPNPPLGHVLNGFVSVIFALHEYVRLFPEDRDAGVKLRECLLSLRESIQFYDTGSWHAVDRRHRDPASENYLVTHTEQLRWLYRITGDAYYNHMRMRWLGFDIERTPVKRGNVVRDAKGIFAVGPEATPQGGEPLRIGQIERYESTPVAKGFGVPELLDFNSSTYFAPLDSNLSEKRPQFVQLRLRQAATASGVTLTLYNPELYPRKIRILVRAEEHEPWRDVHAELSSNGIKFHYRFKPVLLRELRVECIEAAGQKRLVIAELQLARTVSQSQYPEIGLYISDVYQMASGKASISVQRHRIAPDDIHVQYRCAYAFDTLQSLPWALDFLPADGARGMAPPGRYCQFKVTYTNRVPGSGWSQFSVQQASN